MDQSSALFELLKETKLEQFYIPLQNIQVTDLDHFQYVLWEDLEGIGMGNPAIRRLTEALQKRTSKSRKFRRSKLVKRLSSHSATNSSIVSNNVMSSSQTPRFIHAANGLTCLIKESDVRLLTKIGDGSFGEVSQGIWTVPSGISISVAVKTLKVGTLSRSNLLDGFIKEVEVMHQLEHPNLIRLFGLTLSDPLMMVTELAPLGNLLNFLHCKNETISVAKLAKFGIQIANGMWYLEQKHYIHRDIACRNILMFSEDKVKIGDFGLTRCLNNMDDATYIMSEKTRVPFPWCAPESLMSKKFNTKTDVWMFGVTLWEMFSFGKEPWPGLGIQDILNKLKNGERLIHSVSCPSSIRLLINDCFEWMPEKRPSFEQLYAGLSRSPVEVMLVTKNDSHTTLPKPSGVPPLQIQNGESVAIIHGSPELFFWIGQNLSTFEIGYFPRCRVEPLRSPGGSDISAPLANSFIHTGHGDASGKCWGNPTTIDEVYLRNPMHPPDIMGQSSAVADIWNFQNAASQNINGTASKMGFPRNTLSVSRSSEAPKSPVMKNTPNTATNIHQTVSLVVNEINEYKNISALANSRSLDNATHYYSEVQREHHYANNREETFSISSSNNDSTADSWDRNTPTDFTSSDSSSESFGSAPVLERSVGMASNNDNRITGPLGASFAETLASLKLGDNNGVFSHAGAGPSFANAYPALPPPPRSDRSRRSRISASSSTSSFESRTNEPAQVSNPFLSHLEVLSPVRLTPPPLANEKVSQNGDKYAAFRKDMNELIEWLRADGNEFTSYEDCLAALNLYNLDVPSASRFLKIQHHINLMKEEAAVEKKKDSNA